MASIYLNGVKANPDNWADLLAAARAKRPTTARRLVDLQALTANLAGLVGDLQELANQTGQPWGAGVDPITLMHDVCEALGVDPGRVMGDLLANGGGQ